MACLCIETLHNTLNTLHIIIIMITIAYKGCVNISWRHLLPTCHCTYTQSKSYYYYLQPDNNVVMWLHKQNQRAWNEHNTDLDLLNWCLGKENVAGWWGIDTSNEVATGELMDDSNFNIITWYEWAIKQYTVDLENFVVKNVT